MTSRPRRFAPRPRRSTDCTRGHGVRACYDLVLTDLFFEDEPRGYDIARRRARFTPADSGGDADRATELRQRVRARAAHPGRRDPRQADRRRAASIEARAVRAIQTAEFERRRPRRSRVRNRILGGVVPRMVEAKDPTTSGHSERVVGYADTLAVRSAASRTRSSASPSVSRALLHDVGKIGVPELDPVPRRAR